MPTSDTKIVSELHFGPRAWIPRVPIPSQATLAEPATFPTGSLLAVGAVAVAVAGTCRSCLQADRYKALFTYSSPTGTTKQLSPTNNAYLLTHPDDGGAP